MDENNKDGNNIHTEDDGEGGKWKFKSFETQKKLKISELQYLASWWWSNQNNIKETCVLRPSDKLLLCVDTYFIGSQQSEAGAYSITKASEHSPTCMLDNTRTHTKQLNCLNTGLECNKSRLNISALRWKRSYRESKKTLNFLSKERKAYGERGKKNLRMFLSKRWQYKGQVLQTSPHIFLCNHLLHHASSFVSWKCIKT